MQLSNLSHGMNVLVARGRKIPVGTRADVFWIGETTFGVRVGLRLLDGTRVFTNPSNLEPIPAPEPAVEPRAGQVPSEVA